jgi:uncharacterized protein
MPASMKILWRRVDSIGLEVCRLREGVRTHSLGGVVLLEHRKSICRLEYVVECSSAWITREATIKGHVGAREVNLHLRVDSRKRWFLNGRHVDGVDGCVDVDLGFSPSTNLLPIRRLHLRPGVPVAVTACWVEFPSLAVKPLSQTYERRSPRIVHYESAGGRFQRDLETNAGGLVLSYPGLWEAEALG